MQGIISWHDVLLVLFVHWDVTSFKSKVLALGRGTVKDGTMKGGTVKGSNQDTVERPRLYYDSRRLWSWVESTGRNYLKEGRFTGGWTDEHATSRESYDQGERIWPSSDKERETLLVVSISIKYTFIFTRFIGFKILVWGETYLWASYVRRRTRTQRKWFIVDK